MRRQIRKESNNDIDVVFNGLGHFCGVKPPLHPAHLQWMPRRGVIPGEGRRPPQIFVLLSDSFPLLVEETEEQEELQPAATTPAAALHR